MVESKPIYLHCFKVILPIIFSAIKIFFTIMKQFHSHRTFDNHETFLVPQSWNFFMKLPLIMKQYYSLGNFLVPQSWNFSSKNRLKNFKAKKV